MIAFLFQLIIMPLLITVVVEVLLAYVLLKDKDDCKIVVLAQCMTNPVVNAVMIADYYFERRESLLLLLLLEVGAVLAEAIAYRKYFGKSDLKRAIWFSIVANATSFSVGIVL